MEILLKSLARSGVVLTEVTEKVKDVAVRGLGPELNLVTLNGRSNAYSSWSMGWWKII